MGISEYNKLFINKQIPESTENIKNIENAIFGMSVDCNGLLHRISQEIYGYGTKLDGGKITKDEKNQIKHLFKTKDGPFKLELKFLAKLLEVLEYLFCKRFQITHYLILAVDGVPNFAKINQQRLRRFVTANERVESEIDFDSASITTGTPFMVKIDETIKEFITSKRSILPPYVNYSSHNVKGEGEHKIFPIIKQLENRIIEDSKGKLDTLSFRNMNHCVYGKDSDLVMLTSLNYDYNFKLIRESDYKNNIYNVKEYLNIEIIRNFIIENMVGETEITADNKSIIQDFVFISFFIGNDFNVTVSTLDLNNGLSLMLLMQCYNEISNELIEKYKQRYYIINGDGSIFLPMFREFINSFVKYEEQFYSIKQRVQELELFDMDENMTEDEQYELKTSREENGKKGTYVPNPLYQKYNYDSFCKRWISIVAAPSLLYDIYKDAAWGESNENSNTYELVKHNRGKYLALSSKMRNEDLNFIVNDYITGLQWNILYYFGMNVNNWSYKQSLSPCIKNIQEFLNNNPEYIIPDVLMKTNDVVITQKKQLFMVLYHPLSDKLIKECKILPPKDFDNVYSSHERLFPSDFPILNFGKYENVKHTAIPILSRLNLSDIEQIKFSKSNNFEYPIEYYENILIENLYKEVVKIAKDKKTATFSDRDEVREYNPDEGNYQGSKRYQGQSERYQGQSERYQGRSGGRGYQGQSGGRGYQDRSGGRGYQGQSKTIIIPQNEIKKYSSEKTKHIKTEKSFLPHTVYQNDELKDEFTDLF